MRPAGRTAVITYDTVTRDSRGNKGKWHLIGWMNDTICGRYITSNHNEYQPLDEVSTKDVCKQCLKGAGL